jgi:hypothetical protein
MALDIDKLIRELRLELLRLEETISKLEATDSGSRERSKRGRKSVGPAERIQVSERMRRYWADRRLAGRPKAEWP